MNKYLRKLVFLVIYVTLAFSAVFLATFQINDTKHIRLVAQDEPPPEETIEEQFLKFSILETTLGDLSQESAYFFTKGETRFFVSLGIFKDTIIEGPSMNPAIFTFDRDYEYWESPNDGRGSVNGDRAFPR
ncbi:MAG: hypothetical protein LBR37_04410, partial [Erysipelotrichaceae bacterium]|nr:hypothetical protein [Erysipelotrichaceae bacterium]